MQITLGKKLFLYTSGTMILLLLATLLILERSQSRRWEEYLRTQGISFASFATPELLKLFRGSFQARDEAALTGIYELLALNRDLVRFSLLSPSGKILFQSPALPGYSVADLDAPHAEGAGVPLPEPEITSRTLNLSGGVRILDVITPAYGPTGEHILSVRYLISYGSVDTHLHEMRMQFLRIAFVAVICALILVALVARGVTRPLQEVTEGARAITRGELHSRIQVQRRDEIGVLGRAFNDMAESLAVSRAELTNKNNELLRANEELRQMQEHLLRSERLAAIGQLAAGVSHEIDNPVGIILGYAELLLEDFPAEDSRRNDLLAIIEECRRCRRITGGLLGFARTVPAQRELLSLNALVESLFASLRPQKLFKNIDLRFIPAPRPLFMLADGDQLRQIFVNLMLNAAQAMGGQGMLTLELGEEEGKARVALSDAGPGISAQLRERIFEPFFSTKPRGEGTGLGLSVCRKLVEEHGGKIWVEEVYGGGARFQIQFPLAPDEEKNFDNTGSGSIG